MEVFVFRVDYLFMFGLFIVEMGDFSFHPRKPEEYFDWWSCEFSLFQRVLVVSREIKSIRMVDFTIIFSEFPATQCRKKFLRVELVRKRNSESKPIKTRFLLAFFFFIWFRRLPYCLFFHREFFFTSIREQTMVSFISRYLTSRGT